jgi:hypothetical protein
MEQTSARQSYQLAKATGSKTFLADYSCSFGHVPERYVSTMACVTCMRLQNQERYQRNRPHMIIQATRWQKLHPDRRIAAKAKRRAAELRAVPPWLSIDDLFEIEWAYLKALTLSLVTGVPHQVDHIVPLQGRNVCGLHVPWNLRVITATENAAKSNRLLP